jgi:hypothetical protein
MIHIVVGNAVEEKLLGAFELDENLKGEIVVLKDTLGIGRLFVEESTTHDEVRTNQWKEFIPTFEEKVDDEERIKATIEKAIVDEEPLCLWLSACVSDMCAYYWLQTHCKNHAGLLHTINIVGLPFFNDKGTIFYPKNFSEIPSKEYLKCKRLLKEVSPSEYELEGEEWEKFCLENMMVRIYDGGKKVISKEATYYDTHILNSITNSKQKATKVINESFKKITQTVADTFLEYRIRQLIELGTVNSNIETSKSLKDLEVWKGSGEQQTEEVAASLD